jgi:hypothetical protein
MSGGFRLLCWNKLDIHNPISLFKHSLRNKQECWGDSADWVTMQKSFVIGVM